jgi:hypothetical protein
MEPQLRALGLATTLVKGVPSLNNPHAVCATGEKLSSEKCRILKLLGVQMAVSEHLTLVNHVVPLIARNSRSTLGLDGPRARALCKGMTLTTTPIQIPRWLDVIHMYTIIDNRLIMYKMLYNYNVIWLPT